MRGELQRSCIVKHFGHCLSIDLLVMVIEFDGDTIQARRFVSSHAKNCSFDFKISGGALYVESIHV